MPIISIQQADITLYIVKGLFIILAISSASVFGQCRDGGFIILCLVFFIAAVASFFMASWIPIMCGGIIAGLMVFIGSGGMTVRD